MPTTLRWQEDGLMHPLPAGEKEMQDIEWNDSSPLPRPISGTPTSPSYFVSLAMEDPAQAAALCHGTGPNERNTPPPKNTLHPSGVLTLQEVEACLNAPILPDFPFVDPSSSSHAPPPPPPFLYQRTLDLLVHSEGSDPTSRLVPASPSTIQLMSSVRRTTSAANSDDQIDAGQLFAELDKENRSENETTERIDRQVKRLNAKTEIRLAKRAGVDARLSERLSRAKRRRVSMERLSLLHTPPDENDVLRLPGRRTPSSLGVLSSTWRRWPKHGLIGAETRGGGKRLFQLSVPCRSCLFCPNSCIGPKRYHFLLLFREKRREGKRGIRVDSSLFVARKRDVPFLERGVMKQLSEPRSLIGGCRRLSYLVESNDLCRCISMDTRVRNVNVDGVQEGGRKGYLLFADGPARLVCYKTDQGRKGILT